MKEMHVIFFEFVTTFGGARRSTIETAARLATHAKVTIVDAYGCCQPFVDGVRAAGLPLEILKPQKARIVGGAGRGVLRRFVHLAAALPDLAEVRWKLKRLLRNIQPSVICCNETKAMAIASTLGLCPVVGYMRGWYRPDAQVPYVRYLMRHQLDHLIAVSQATRAALLSGGVPWERISVVSNPADVPELELRARLPLERALPQSHRPIRILLPALYQKEKGQHTAVAALAELVRKGHDACLYLAGEVPFSSPSEYVSEVQNLAKRLGVQDRVEWLGFRGDIPALIRASTAVVLPSLSEGMPRSLIETMALGRPMVSTPVGGITDLILNGVTGLLVEPEDPPALASALARIIATPVEAEWMVQNAKRLIEEQHSIELHTQRLLEVLQKVARLSQKSVSPEFILPQPNPILR